MSENPDNKDKNPSTPKTITPIEYLNSIPDQQKTELITALNNRPPTFRDLSFASRNLADLNASDENTIDKIANRLNKNQLESKYDAAQLGQDTAKEWTKNVNPIYKIDDSSTTGLVTGFFKIWPFAFCGTYAWNHFLSWKPLNEKMTWKKHLWPRIKYCAGRSAAASTIILAFYASAQHYMLENFQPDNRAKQSQTKTKVFYHPQEIAEAGFQVVLPNKIEIDENNLANKAQFGSEKIRENQMFRKQISDEDYERMMFSLSSGMIKSGHALNQRAYDRNRQHENAIKFWEDKKVGDTEKEK